MCAVHKKKSFKLISGGVNYRDRLKFEGIAFVINNLAAHRITRGSCWLISGTLNQLLQYRGISARIFGHRFIPRVSQRASRVPLSE